MRIGTGFDIKRRCISHAVAAMAVIAAYLPLSAADDDYRFIIDDSSYPAANVCSSEVSEGIALETGTMFALGESASAVDSRYRSFDVSQGRALNARKWRAISITFR